MFRSRRRLTAMVAAGVLVAAGLVAGPANPAHAQTACSVTYSTNDWGSGSGGFTASVNLTNLGAPLSSWNLTFTFPAGQQVTQGWSARWSQSGSQVTAQNESWNGNVATNGTVSVGFNGSWSGSNPAPTNFAVNGVACNGTGPGDNEPPTVSITSPAAGASFTAPADVTVAASASDSDGSIDRVEFYRNGSLAGTDTTAPYSYTHAGLPAGEYELLVRAYDDAGDSADDSVTVTVTESTEPTVITSLNTVNFTEGSSGTFTVRLSHAPDAPVTVSTERTGGSSGITVSGGASLSFSTTNWATPQSVTLTAAEGTGGQSAEFSSAAPGYGAATVTANALASTGQDSVWVDRFMEQYDKIKNSGYFSSHGIPYHAIETLIVEAPDYGHVTTSEAFSFWIWMEAYYGRITEDWGPFNQSWEIMETYIIPSSADQPSAGAAGDAQYAAEHPQPSNYPSPLEPDVPVGADPLRNELRNTHGTGDIYGMHWLLDVDNAYGYGRCGDGTTSPSYINTFQRGEQESVWETVPHPSCETFDFGASDGFLSLYIDDPGDGARQWRYTNAPDADARAIQAAYWALQWATEQGNQSQVTATVTKAAKMGDYMRYALFDKYFKRVGNCVGAMACPAASGRDGAHYLLSWYYAWGGSYPSNDWSWRIGSSHNHFGYQNPMSAYAMVSEPALRTSSPTFVSDWENSLDRTIEFYQWLQSADGAIAGGATNSWGGNYGTPPAGTPTFYGMFYDANPVYKDPGSNEWFGMQVWSLQRLAEYLYLTDDPRARSVLDRWVPWAIGETTIGAGGDYAVPAGIEWSGAPDTWNPSNPGSNSGLRVTVTAHNQDVGVTAAYARTLMWYAAATGDTEAQETALALIEALHANAGPRGITTVEERPDYARFLDVWNTGDQQGIYIPPGWSGVMGNGETVEPGVTFYDIRSFYQNDPDIDRVLAYANGTGPVPTFEYHRSWAQMDIAMAFSDYAFLFPQG